MTTFASLILIVGVFFHTPVEIEDWKEDWFLRADQGLSVSLLQEYFDMRDRHPWYFNPQPIYLAPAFYSAGVDRWKPLVATYFPAEQVKRALCVMQGESGGDPNITNRQGSSAAGLFQFLRSTWDNMVPLSVSGGTYDSGQVLQPEANIRSAAWLWTAIEAEESDGWTQWSWYNRGNCR